MGETKFIRTHVQVQGKDGIYRLQKRDVKLPALPLQSKTCPVCHEKMRVAEGQVMRMHKACKKELKHPYGR